MSNFQLKVGEVLGFKYQSFIGKQKALAISNPDKYYKERNALDSDIKEGIATLIYDQLFIVLTSGLASASGTAVISNAPVNYPPQKINDLVLDLVASLAEELADIVNLVYPDDFMKIADSRLVIKQKGESVNIGTSGVAPTV